MATSSNTLFIRNRRPALLVAALALSVALAGSLSRVPYRREHNLDTATLERLKTLIISDPANAQAFYFLALRLRDAGKIAPARVAVARAAELDPESEAIALTFASLSNALNRDPETFHTLTSFLIRHPKSAAGHLMLALFHAVHHSPVYAWKEAHAAAELRAYDARTWRLMGSQSLLLHHASDAEGEFRRAIATEGSSWRGYQGLGDALQALSRPQEALEAYTKAASLAPSEAGPLAERGRLLLGEATTPQELAAAVGTLKQAARRSAMPITLLALGQGLTRQGHFQEARAALEAAARLSVLDPAPHYNLSRFYQRRGDLVSADRERLRFIHLTRFQRSKQFLIDHLEPYDPQTALKLARLCAANEDRSEAMRQYQRLQVSAPGMAEAHREYAALIAKKTEGAPQSGARPGAEGAVPMGPMDPINAADKARLADADALLAQQRYADAERIYRGVLARSPQSARALQGVGLAEDAQGHYGAAFVALQRAVTLGSRSIEAQFALAHFYYINGFHGEAARRMERLIAQEPGRPLYLNALALCYFDNPDLYQRADQLLARAVALSPSNPAFLRNAARMMAKQDHGAEAERLFRRSLQISPDDPETLANLGGFLLEYQPSSERNREALQMLKRAVSLKEADATTLLALGRATFDQGDCAGAKRYLSASLSKRPRFAAAWYQMARAEDRLGHRLQAAACRRTFYAISRADSDLANTEERVHTDPRNASARLKLARLYAQSGHNDRAINQYENALSFSEDHQAARAELAALRFRLKANGTLPRMVYFNAMLKNATVNSAR